MRFKIRTKLILAFSAILSPFLAVMGVIVFYHLNVVYNDVQRVEAVAREMNAVMSLELSLDRSLMPGNDYIITGAERYRDTFMSESQEVEEWLREIGSLPSLGEEVPGAAVKRGILKEVEAAWGNIQEISFKIFAIPEPVGAGEAARLMEDMDYRWAYPALENLNTWRVMNAGEYGAVHEKAERAFRNAWMISIAGSLILLVFGVFFALFYSRIFVRPIEAIQDAADHIATGDFKARVEVRTGDEIQRLADAMNEMAAQLDLFASNLQGMVDERTRELEASKEKLQERVDELEAFRKATIKRELRMEELKRKVAEMEKKLEKSP